MTHILYGETSARSLDKNLNLNLRFYDVTAPDIIHIEDEGDGEGQV